MAVSFGAGMYSMIRLVGATEAARSALFRRETSEALGQLAVQLDRLSPSSRDRLQWQAADPLGSEERNLRLEDFVGTLEALRGEASNDGKIGQTESPEDIQQLRVTLGDLGESLGDWSAQSVAFAPGRRMSRLGTLATDCSLALGALIEPAVP